MFEAITHFAIEYIKVQCLHGEPIVEHEHVEREDEF